jgi:hypothetical protein
VSVVGEPVPRIHHEHGHRASFLHLAAEFVEQPFDDIAMPAHCRLVARSRPPSTPRWGPRLQRLQSTFTRGAFACVALEQGIRFGEREGNMGCPCAGSYA